MVKRRFSFQRMHDHMSERKKTDFDRKEKNLKIENSRLVISTTL